MPALCDNILANFLQTFWGHGQDLSFRKRLEDTATLLRNVVVKTRIIYPESGLVDWEKNSELMTNVIGKSCSFPYYSPSSPLRNHVVEIQRWIWAGFPMPR